MSVLHVIEQAAARSGGDAWNAAGSSERVFKVICSEGTDDESVVLNAVDPVTSVSIPALLAPHPTRGALLSCASRNVKWTDNFGRESEVSISYEWNWNMILPWELPVIYNGSSTTYEQICDKDVSTGFSICNSAHEPFDPPVMATRENWTMEAIKSYNSMPTFVANVVGTVNSTSFYGFNAGYVKCVGAPFVQNQFVFEGATIHYWTVTWSFAFNLNIPHQPVILDAGFKRLSSDGSKLITIIMPDGKEPSSPVPLDGSGQPLDMTDESGEPAALNFLNFSVYYTYDFNSLGV